MDLCYVIVLDIVDIGEDYVNILHYNGEAGIFIKSGSKIFGSVSTELPAVGSVERVLLGNDKKMSLCVATATQSDIFVL